MRKLLLSFVLVALLPACATAQVSESVHARNDCRLALRIVETGHPAPHTRWAYEQVGRCGAEAGQAVAGALRRARQSHDTVLLDIVSRPAQDYRDARIFEAAREIALDQGSSIPARVFAFRVLIHALSPGSMIRYTDLTEQAGAGRGCFGLGPHTHQTTTAGLPLAPDYASRVGDAATVVLGSDAPEQVRRAATCVTLHLRVLRRGGSTP